MRLFPYRIYVLHIYCCWEFPPSGCYRFILNILKNHDFSKCFSRADVPSARVGINLMISPSRRRPSCQVSAELCNFRPHEAPPDPCVLHHRSLFPCHRRPVFFTDTVHILSRQTREGFQVQAGGDRRGNLHHHRRP